MDMEFSIIYQKPLFNNINITSACGTATTIKINKRRRFKRGQLLHGLKPEYQMSPTVFTITADNIGACVL
jgi:hypothetical protein